MFGNVNPTALAFGGSLLASGGGPFGQAFGNAIGAAQQVQQQRAAQEEAAQLNRLRMLQAKIQLGDYQRREADALAAEEEKKRARGQALAAQGQAEEVRQLLPPPLQEVFDIDQKRALDLHFPQGMTPYQQAQVDLAQEKFGLAERGQDFDERMAIAEQQRLGEKAIRDEQILNPEQSRFYIQRVEGINKEFDADKERYDSASASLKAGTAQGDKAALVHLARLISDEALNESDIARQLADGLLPGWFERAWNSSIGKGELKAEDRAAIQDQLEREMQAKASRYSLGREYLSNSFSPTVEQSERDRVLGKDRLHGTPFAPPSADDPLGLFR